MESKKVVLERTFSTYNIVTNSIDKVYLYSDGTGLFKREFVMGGYETKELDLETTWRFNETIKNLLNNQEALPEMWDQWQ